MPSQPDASSGDKGVVWTTPTGDFGQEGSQPGPTGHQDAKPGLDSSQHAPVAGELPLPKKST